MSRIYGVFCDRCKNAIPGPSQHYKISIRSELQVSNGVKKDLCASCSFKVEDFIRPSSLDEATHPIEIEEAENWKKRRESEYKIEFKPVVANSLDEIDHPDLKIATPEECKKMLTELQTDPMNKCT